MATTVSSALKDYISKKSTSNSSAISSAASALSSSGINNSGTAVKTAPVTSTNSTINTNSGMSNYLNTTGGDATKTAPTTTVDTTASYMQHNATDLATLNQSQLDQIANLRVQASSGAITWAEANTQANAIRADSGYSVDNKGAVTTVQPTYEMPSYEEWLAQSGYYDYNDQVQAQISAIVNQAVNGYNTQIEQTNQDSDELARQAYVAKMVGSKNLEQELSASGYSGGMADSQKIAVESGYQNNIAAIEQQRFDTISQLEMAIQEARLSGDLQAAEQLSDFLVTIQSQWGSFVATQQAQQYQTGVNNQSTAHSQAMDLLYMGQMPTQTLLDSAGIDTTTAYGYLQAYKEQNPEVAVTPTVSSTSSGGGGGYNNGSLTTEQVKALQTEMGVTADGLWGSNSSAAAGGLSADDAWAKIVGDSGTASTGVTSNSDNYTAINSGLNQMYTDGATFLQLLAAVNDTKPYLTEAEYNKLYNYWIVGKE